MSPPAPLVPAATTWGGASWVALVVLPPHPPIVPSAVRTPATTTHVRRRRFSVALLALRSRA